MIGDRDLTDYVPLIRAKEGEITTQFAMNPLTELGMLKMDFLGLKTLTVIQNAVDLIHNHTPDFSIEKISLEDQNTFDLLNRGETVGVFQLESGGMMNLCRQFDVNRVEDIIALIALYRPGPMELIPDFIDRKKGKKKVRYLHPLLEEASEETFGILIYQEQVQRAANLLAGYSLGEADILRRAMGKKKPEEMAKQRIKFVEGCKEVNSIPEGQANKIFDLLEKFAGYGFNKSHSAAYGLISYQTAFLKANYPVEFMAALLSNEINNTDKISIFVAECQRMGIKILAPDINHSGPKFGPEKRDDGGKAIRYGLSAIKNVGGAAMEAAIEERNEAGPFSSLEHFAMRLDSKAVNRKILENLIKAGAFDFTIERRDDMFSRVGCVLNWASSIHRDRASGQMGLFGNEAEPEIPDQWDIPEEDRVVWSEEEYLSHEKDLLGFYVTGHPLDKYRAAIEAGNFRKLGELQQLRVGAKQRFSGIVSTVQEKYTKQGKPFAIIVLEDFTGQTEVMIWNEVFEKRKPLIEKGAVLVLKAKVEEDSRTEMKRLTAQDIFPLKIDPGAKVESGGPAPKPQNQNAEPTPEEMAAAVPQQQGSVDDQTGLNQNTDPAPTSAHHQIPGEPVVLHLDCIRDTAAALSAIKAAAGRFPGPRPLQFSVRRPNGNEILVAAGEKFAVSDQFLEEAEVAALLSP